METVLIIQPFRKPKFKDMVVSNYPYWEVVNVEPLTMAAVIEKAGYDVHFYALQNMFKSYSSQCENDFDSVLGKINPDILVISTDYYMANGSTAIFFCVNLVIDYYKKHGNIKRIILTGRNALSLRKENFSLIKDLDVVIKGECENIICDILNSKEHELKNIQGIIFKSGTEIIENLGYWKIENWDNIPLPAFHLLGENIEIIQNIVGVKMKHLPITLRTSFGCVKNCNYCAGIENWNNYHLKPIGYLEEEIELVYRLFPNTVQLYFLADEIFTVNKEHVKAVVEILSKKKIKVMGLFAHTKYFDDEIAELVKEITDTVLFGAENCCDSILKLANKGQSFGDLLDCVKLAKKHKLKVSLEWIVGLPGEDVETAIKNLHTIYKMIATNVVDHINTYVFCPHPNTEFDVNKSKFDLKIDKNYDDMLEEGGYPCSKTSKMTKNQIFIYYLISQLIINDAHEVQGNLPEDYEVGNYNIEMFRELFDKIRE